MGIPILDIIDVIGKVIDRVIPDPQAKMDLQLKLAALADQEAAREHDEMMGQIATNTAEAGSDNMFVAGWRPAVGWICAAGLGYSTVVEPVMSWVATVVFKYGGNFPVLDTGMLYGLLTGMLGFGGLRTYEKIKGLTDSTPIAVAPIATPTVQPKGLGPKVFGKAWPF